MKQYYKSCIYSIIVLLFVCLFKGNDSFAQTKKNNTYQYHIKKASSEIKIDGFLAEPAWQDAQAAADFCMVLPMDTACSNMVTQVRLTYDNRYLYISAINFQNKGYVIESLRRDWTFSKNDNFVFFLDPFDDQTNGFTFGANAAGAQWDGQQYDGGSANLNWDNKWYSAVKQYPDRWVFEAAIPFKSIRYKKGISRWGINFSRNEVKTPEKSAWAPVPRQFPTASLAYTGMLVWDTPPPVAGANVSIIPFLLGGITKDFSTQSSSVYRKDFGFDAKVAVTSSLNMDLTYNPDFSQVEVDRQVTNFERFELFFPERRQFFLENSDLFNNLGYDRVRPFFSRRIGLNAPIQFGARLSGKLDKDWRIGIMDIQTNQVANSDLPSQNFAVMTLQRRVFARSNITGFFINKESLNYTPDTTKTNIYSRFNRSYGLEYNLASANNAWRGKALYFKSLSPTLQGDDHVVAAGVSYNAKKLNWEFSYDYLGHNYNPEVGYVQYTPGKGYHRFTPNFSYRFFPKSKKLVSHGVSLGHYVFFDKGPFRTIDNQTFLAYNFTFINQSAFVLWTANNYQELQKSFDPTNFTTIKLAEGSKHTWYSWGTSYDSRPQSKFTYGFDTRYGGFYADGTRLRIAPYLSYRFQPYGSIAIDAEYNEIKFNGKEQLKDAYFWLVSPRIDLTFTDKMYLTTFVQYNEQAKNVNVNARFQWRYAPASDLFLVYTDNYIPNTLLPNNRAIVLKFTYWWNI
jgi:Domain of unknown function (DUF5916)/Carbohydrate family 9 binding domain-like